MDFKRSALTSVDHCNFNILWVMVIALPLKCPKQQITNCAALCSGLWCQLFDTLINKHPVRSINVSVCVAFLHTRTVCLHSWSTLACRHRDKEGKCNATAFFQGEKTGLGQNHPSRKSAKRWRASHFGSSARDVRVEDKNPLPLRWMTGSLSTPSAHHAAWYLLLLVVAWSLNLVSAEFATVGLKV